MIWEGILKRLSRTNAYTSTNLTAHEEESHLEISGVERVNPLHENLSEEVRSPVLKSAFVYLYVIGATLVAG